MRKQRSTGGHFEIDYLIPLELGGADVTLEKLIALADRCVAQGQGKIAIEAVKAMTEQNSSKL